MAITPLPHPTPAGVLAEACAGLDSWVGTLWSARPDAELVAGVEELQQLKARAAALEAELLAELDAREVPKRQLAWGSTADWFTHLAGTTRGHGRRTVAHARLLVGQRSATLHALHEGTVSLDQAAVIVDAIDRLPQATHLRRHGEQVLLDEAAGSTPPTSTTPAATSPGSSTPTAPNARPRRHWPEKTVPPTWAGSSPSAPTAAAESGSEAPAPSRTPPPCGQPCCR